MDIILTADNIYIDNIYTITEHILYILLTWQVHVEDRSSPDDIEHSNDFVTRQVNVNGVNGLTETYLCLLAEVL